MKPIDAIVTAALLTLSLVAGCGGGNDDVREPSATAGVVDAVDASPFVGAWRTRCYAFDDNGFSDAEEYFVADLTLGGDGTFEQVFREYPDAACTGESVRAPGVQARIRGTYALGAPVPTRDGVTAIELGITGTDDDGEPFFFRDIVHLAEDALYLGVDNFEDRETRTDALNFDRPYYRLR